MQLKSIGSLALLMLIFSAEILVSSPALAQSVKETPTFNEIQSKLFPTWGDDLEDKENRSEANISYQSETEIIKGMVGQNRDGKRIFQYLPRIANLLLQFGSPVIVAMMIYSGVRGIIANGDEDDITKAKDFFLYAVIGGLFMILSYSIMRIVYNIIATG